MEEKPTSVKTSIAIDVFNIWWKKRKMDQPGEAEVARELLVELLQEARAARAASGLKVTAAKTSATLSAKFWEPLSWTTLS